MEVAEAALESLPPDATPEMKAMRKTALLAAKLDANYAFKKAGLPEPYPGIFP